MVEVYFYFSLTSFVFIWRSDHFSVCVVEDAEMIVRGVVIVRGSLFATFPFMLSNV